PKNGRRESLGEAGGIRTRIVGLRGRHPGPLDDSLDGGPGGNRTLISWGQARDPPVERRAPRGEDNGTRTRTFALATRCLSLRLCPLQDGPAPWTRTTIGRVKSPACCVDTAEDGAATGDRTPTSAVPGPHASVITMATWSEWPDSNRSSSAWKAEVL